MSFVHTSDFVAMATETLNLPKKKRKKKKENLRSHKEDKVYRNVITFACIKLVYFYCHCSCAFVAMTTLSFYCLVMGKVKLGHFFPCLNC